jgi:hypothetical protein
MKPRQLVLIAGLTFAATLPGLAQTQPKTDDPVLSGPKVKEDGVPGEQRQFTPGRTRGKDMMGGEIPHRNFMRAVENLKGSEEMGVRLTPEQQSKIREINETFTATVAKYRAEHREEVRELLTQLTPEDRRRAQEFLTRNGEGRRPEIDKRKNVPKKSGDGPAMDEKPDPKKAETARERIKELLGGAPNPSDTHAKIYGVLTDAQKQAFKSELQKVREEMESRRGSDSKEQPKGKPEAPKDGGKDAGKDADINDPRIPERARERLKNMTPQQREEALKRFLEERGKRRKPD